MISAVTSTGIQQGLARLAVRENGSIIPSIGKALPTGINPQASASGRPVLNRENREASIAAIPPRIEEARDRPPLGRKNVLELRQGERETGKEGQAPARCPVVRQRGPQVVALNMEAETPSAALEAERANALPASAGNTVVAAGVAGAVHGVVRAVLAEAPAALVAAAGTARVARVAVEAVAGNKAMAVAGAIRPCKGRIDALKKSVTSWRKK